MTAQASDILIHRGEKLELFATPLESYLKRLPKSRRPNPPYITTACWRGYIATWEIVGTHLYLVDVDTRAPLGGRVPDDDQANPPPPTFRHTGLQDIFPKAKGPVHATWVTDFLRCPEGEMLEYIHFGFASGFERDRYFDVSKGEVTGEFLRLNPPSPVHYLIRPSGERICVEHFNCSESEALTDPCAGDAIPTQAHVWRIA